MDRALRKAAVNAYKEQKVETGIYAIRSLIDDQRWIGIAPNLATIENRQRFTLGLGKSPSRSLQAAWNAKGAESFVFEVLEVVGDDVAEYDRNRVLKARQQAFAAELNAEVF